MTLDSPEMWYEWVRGGFRADVDFALSEIQARYLNTGETRAREIAQGGKGLCFKYYVLIIRGWLVCSACGNSK